MLKALAKRGWIPLFMIVQMMFLASLSPAQENRMNSGQLQSQEAVDEDQMRERMEMVRAIRENIGLFGEVYRQVSMRYVDQVNPEAFMKAGIDGMLSTLDPYTEYMEPEGSEDLQIMSKGRYGGVGLQIGTRGSERILTVVSPIEGTPAWRLGVRAGDQILFIDSTSTEGMSTSEAAQMMRGTPGEPVTLKIRRPGVEDMLEYTIVREVIQVRDVSFAGIIEDGIGYVRLTRFSRQAGEEVKLAIEDLKSQGLTGLILDLRSNPGGLLPEAIAVSENFLQPGDMIVSTRGRNEEMNAEFRAEEPPVLDPEIPLVVLINEGSASASEIVSGAVQDLDRGVVIGKTSFGKGLVQSVINFNNGTALRVTTAKYYTPSGRLIQKVDYFSDNESIVHTFLDDEDSTYVTSHGREVSARGGIEPDLMVEQSDVGELTIQLWRQDKYFDFASDYLAAHQQLEDWRVGSEIYSEFQTYLDTTEFSFESDAQRRLKALKEAATEQEYGPSFIAGIDSLMAEAERQKTLMMERERAAIEYRLRLELASVMAGSAGRVEASLADDPQVQEAVRLLREPEQYQAALEGRLETASLEP